MIQFAAILLFVTYANAVAYDWVGQSGTWHNATNWNPTGVPTCGDDAFITGASRVLVTTDTQIQSLSVSGCVLELRNATLHFADLRISSGAVVTLAETSQLTGNNLFVLGATINISQSQVVAQTLWLAGWSRFDLDAGHLLFSSTLWLVSAVVTGNGTISAPAITFGAGSVVKPVGHLHLYGDTTFGPSSQLTVVLSPWQQDQLNTLIVHPFAVDHVVIDDGDATTKPTLALQGALSAWAILGGSAEVITCDTCLRAPTGVFRPRLDKQT